MPTSFQDQGLGTKLLDMLIGVSEEKGLESIYGIILPENREMISVCEKLGFKATLKDDNIFVELKLSAAPVEGAKQQDVGVASPPGAEMLEAN